MVRRTSKEAYDKIRENGLLSLRRWEVYQTVYHHGPLTSGEAFSKMPNLQHETQGGNIHARMTELRDAGVVYEVQERQCAVTGMTVIEWDVTENLPIKIKKQKKRTRLDITVEALRSILEGVPNPQFVAAAALREIDLLWKGK